MRATRPNHSTIDSAFLEICPQVTPVAIRLMGLSGVRRSGHSWMRGMRSIYKEPSHSCPGGRKRRFISCNDMEKRRDPLDIIVIIIRSGN